MRSYGPALIQLNSTSCQLIPRPHDSGASSQYVEIQTVAPGDAIDATNGVRPFVPNVVEQTHVFEANPQKQILSENKRKSKNKSLEYTQFLVEKSSIHNLIFGQCDEATKTKIPLGETYAVDCKEVKLINFIN